MDPEQVHSRPRRYRRRMEAKYRRRRFVVGTVACTAVGGLVVGGLAPSRLQSNLSSSPLRSDDTAEIMNDNTHGTNILILGSDTRDLEDNVYGDAGGDRSDAMLLAHLSEDESRIEAVQVPRDTMMDLPPCDDTGHGSSAGGYGAVNSALNAGPACSVAAVEALSVVRLDHFIEMNFEGFTTMVDALDGVPECLPEPLQDSKASLDLPAGEQIVNGRDALALARTRHAVGDGSDIARMGHQQQVMSAIVQRAKSSEVLTRPDRLYGFLDAVTSSLTVDEDLKSLSALASLATDAANVEDTDISFRVMPWEEEPADRNRVIPSAEAAEVFQRVRADQPLDGVDEAAADEQADSADQDAELDTTAGDSEAGSSGTGESDSAPAQSGGQQGQESATAETAGDMFG
ncbi:LCP family protein [Brevibacterium luteolum]|uniref:Transcriptional regulator n=1 Tax=Brevibacterium luteolum TaxID=199591 RepID=A0A2N6PFI4_9MICO|nr:LCP family protein [Brevibacterium luteolum]PMB97444.1 transcriptional regulator [Brevibacterium luteolum]